MKFKYLIIMNNLNNMPFKKRNFNSSKYNKNSRIPFYTKMLKL